MSRAGWLLGLMLLIGAARADALIPNDFAYGIRLATPPDATLYRLPMPETVYRDVVDPNMADLRVFNADSQVVPYSLEETPPGGTGEVQARDLPIFPLPPKSDKEKNGTVSVVTNGDGNVVRVERGDAVPDNTVGAYLLDLSRLPKSVRGAADVELKLHWQAAAGQSMPQGFVVPLSFEAGKTLDQWHALDAKGTIADLEYRGRQLSRDTVDIAPGDARYLRLAWPEALQGYQLTRVEAFVRAAPPGERLRQMEISAEPAKAGETGKASSSVFNYDLGGHFPVRQVGLKLPESNTLVEVLIESRPTATASWRQRYQGVAYDLQLNGGTLRSKPVSILPGDDRYWRVSVGNAGGGLGVGAPMLLVSWQPHELYVVARGRGPFLLAFGNAALKNRPGDSAALVKTLRDAGQLSKAVEAEARERVPLGGPGRLRPPEPGVAWSRILLWAVLLIGVGVLGLMALRLYRQMEDER